MYTKNAAYYFKSSEISSNSIRQRHKSVVYVAIAKAEKFGRLDRRLTRKFTISLENTNWFSRNIMEMIDITFLS
jgi:hypothetical protein